MEPRRVATLCRPNTKNRKTGLKLTAIGALKNGKKRFRPFGDRSVELDLAFVFNKTLWGVGYLAEVRRQRAAKEIAKIAEIAKIEIEMQNLKQKPQNGLALIALIRK